MPNLDITEELKKSISNSLTTSKNAANDVVYVEKYDAFFYFGDWTEISKKKTIVQPETDAKKVSSATKSDCPFIRVKWL